MGIDLHSDIAVESIDHCFIECNKARSLWEKIFCWWGLSQFNVRSICDLISFEGPSYFSSIKKLIWQAVIWTSLYSIWCSRNAKVFNVKVAAIPDLLGDVQTKAFVWVSSRAKQVTVEWEDWKKWPINFS